MDNLIKQRDQLYNLYLDSLSNIKELESKINVIYDNIFACKIQEYNKLIVLNQQLNILEIEHDKLSKEFQKAREEFFSFIATNFPY